jgi:hypothetical protein
MPNLQQSMTIGVDEEFYDYLVSGTSAKGWHLLMYKWRLRQYL